MKNLILLSVIFFLSCTTVTAQNEQNVLTITAPPSIWAFQNGNELEGPVIDILQEIFSDYNIQVSTRILPWARAIEQVKNGDIDAIAVIFYTDQRAEFLQFTDPYIDVPTAVFVSKGNEFNYRAIADLQGKTGLVMRGDSISAEFESYRHKLTLSEVAGYDQAVKMLVNGRADYAIAAKYGFLSMIHKEGFSGNIESLPHAVSTRNLHMAFSKKSPFIRYIPHINSKIENMKNKGDIKRILETSLMRPHTMETN